MVSRNVFALYEWGGLLLPWPLRSSLPFCAKHGVRPTLMRCVLCVGVRDALNHVPDFPGLC